MTANAAPAQTMQTSSMLRAPPRPIEQLIRFQHVAAGEAHSAAIDFHGHLYTWGFAGSGALGHGVAGMSATPGDGRGTQNSPRCVAHFRDAGIRVEKVSWDFPVAHSVAHRARRRCSSFTHAFLLPAWFCVPSSFCVRTCIGWVRCLPYCMHCGRERCRGRSSRRRPGGSQCWGSACLAAVRVDLGGR